MYDLSIENSGGAGCTVFQRVLDTDRTADMMRNPRSVHLFPNKEHHS